MRLGHALLSVFVGQDRGSCGVKRRVVIGMVEVPVCVDDVFQRSVAKATESLFESGPGGRNKSVHDEFAAGAVEGYNPSAWAVEHSDTIAKLLRFHRHRVELSPHAPAHVSPRSDMVRLVR